MLTTRRTPASEALTNLMLDLFRLNGLLLTAGDRLVARLGLTSARWQILGAIVGAERPQPVAWLARDLGANRQNVQRIINDLHKDGKRTFDAAMALQAPWINGLSEGLAVKDIETVHRVITAVRKKLEGDDEREERA
jgi:hypothetical protein